MKKEFLQISRSRFILVIMFVLPVVQLLVLPLAALLLLFGPHPVRPRRTHYLAPVFLELMDLAPRGFDVARIILGHRLDGDGRRAADHHSADIDGYGLTSRNHHRPIY